MCVTAERPNPLETAPQPCGTRVSAEADEEDKRWDEEDKRESEAQGASRAKEALRDRTNGKEQTNKPKG